MKDTKPSLWESFLVIALLIVMLMINIFFNKDDTLQGGSQIALLLTALVAGYIAWKNGIPYKKLEKGMMQTISSSLPALIILLLVGSLAATWMISGIIPTIINYSLYILRPAYFLPAVMVICSIVSLATGSSWSTIATIGVALLSTGSFLGINEAATAGAIISGAYLGDKISPMSDTTNLASASVGVDLFVHIKYMISSTSLYSMILSLIIYTAISLFGRHTGVVDVTQIQMMLNDNFNITPLVFIIPVIVGIMIYKKLPASVTLFVGALLGLAAAAIFQPELLHKMAASNNLNYFTTLVSPLYRGSVIDMGDPVISDLLTTKGMAGMLNTVWLILSAMIFGGIMVAGGFLQRLTNLLLARVHSDAGLVTTTSLACVFFNMTTSDQFITIILSGKMFEESFKKRKLAPEVLSRTIEDSGTVTSVLVPWNSCGATQSAILGVATLAYLPFAFFCYISPIMTILSGITGVLLKKKLRIN